METSLITVVSGVSTPARFNYPTVRDFTRAVAACQKPAELTTMWSKLFNGAKTWTGIHPWSSAQQEYHDCWKAIFAKAFVAGWLYHKKERKFY